MTAQTETTASLRKRVKTECLATGAGAKISHQQALEHHHRALDAMEAYLAKPNEITRAARDAALRMSGAMLRAIREELFSEALHQGEFADHIGFTRSTVCHAEKRERVSLQMAMAVHALLAATA